MEDPNIFEGRVYLSCLEKSKRKKVINLLNANKNKISYNEELGCFEVRSERFINKFYKVFAHKDHAWSCSCQGKSLYNTDQCKHIRAVKAFIISFPHLVKKYKDLL